MKASDAHTEMPAPLQILLLEDSAADAGLIEHALRKSGMEFTARRVQTDATFRATLAGWNPQIVLADYNVPGFRGDAALAVVRDLTAELPVIFVSGTIGEERAVELMRAGATDYVLKDRLERLPFSVRRALDELEQREARRRAEDAVRRSGETLSLALEASQMGTWDWDIAGGGLDWSERCKAIFGIPAEEPMNYGRFLRAVHADDRARTDAAVIHALATKTPYDIEYRAVWADGSIHWMVAMGRAFYDEASGKPVRMTGTALDITERKVAEEKLRESHGELEHRVVERTEELRAAVHALEREISERQRLEREILEISEREQNRLGQDLHDDLGQQLTGIMLLARVIYDRLAAESHEQAESAETIMDLLQQAVSAARDLAKGFYPVELESYGLFAALEDLANRTEKVAKIRCHVVCDESFRYEKSAAIHLYRIVQESISNALRHGAAKNIVIDCTAADGPPTLTVRDDGSGFNKPKGKYDGMGLRLFDYRARLIGAKIRVTKGGKHGCIVRCTLSGKGSGQG